MKKYSSINEVDFDYFKKRLDEIILEESGRKSNLSERFGVEYLTDGMFYNEVKEIADFLLSYDDKSFDMFFSHFSDLIYDVFLRNAASIIYELISEPVFNCNVGNMLFQNRHSVDEKLYVHEKEKPWDNM